MRSDPARTQKCNQLFLCFSCFSTKGTESRQTVKLTLYHRATAPLHERRAELRARYVQTLIHRNEPNRPHISSVIQQCQRATSKMPTSEVKNRNVTPISQRTACPTSKMPQSLLSVPPPLQRPQQHLSAAGERPSKDNNKQAQAQKQQNL